MKYILLTALALTLAACATPKVWTATGGSRADGIVRLAYDVGAFESPVLDEAQAISVAQQRCAVWGYTGAEAFGGMTTVCNVRDGYGSCMQATVTKEYQCTGKPDASLAPGPHVITVPAPLLGD